MPTPDGYHKLVLRVNKYPQGAPPSELLYRILAILLSEREADLVSRLPLRPFSASKAARIWRFTPSEARRTLEGLASRGLLIDLEHQGRTMYFLPPPMVGFFESSLMRVRRGINQKELAGLFYQYLNIEEEFIRELFSGGETGIGRVFVNEAALPPDLITTEVLPYERASEVIRTASRIAVGLCYCRHKMALVGRGCQAPPDNCMTFNGVATSLVRHGNARQIDAAEGMDLLQEARSHHLVQCGDNVRNQVSFMCHCCGCCCEGLSAWRRLQIPRRQFSTNFVAQLEAQVCNGCGGCVRVCPAGAIEMGPGGCAEAGGRRRAVLDQEVCLGCGVCVGNCQQRAIRLEARPDRVITPVNLAHRVVLMAIERGKLQHLIFDNQAYLSHRALAAILGAILKLPPLQRLMASRQLKSRFLERIMRGVEVADFSS